MPTQEDAWQHYPPRDVMDAILIVNAGSSSVKFQVFDATGPRRLLKGQIDGIGTKPRLRAEAADRRVLIDQRYPADQVSDVPAALSAAGAWLREEQKLQPMAVGHRVVHGGPKYDGPILIDAAVLAELERYVPLAPLHQPHNLAAVQALRARFPELPQIACCDTAFHRSHGAIADHFALPESLYTEGVRRYGFHGLSYEYIADRLQTVAPEIAHGRVIVAHLGSGASMCALRDGRSVDSTMGFTALDGLPMGTRPGQIDPGVVLYLIMQKGMDPAAVQNLLYRDSGLKGLSGISNDMRELQFNEEPRAKLAVDYFVHRAGLCTGMLAAALGGLDAFVFTAGIGENSPVIRSRIAEKLAWLGVELHDEANAAGGPLISTPRSEIAVYVIPTDEELMIARHTISVLSKQPTRAKVQEEIAS
jgi:acetate kinase